MAATSRLGKADGKWAGSIEKAVEASGSGQASANEPLIKDRPAPGHRIHAVASEALSRMQGPKIRGTKSANPKLIASLRQHSVSGQVDKSRLRKFLIRLATALHAYGSSAARTEYLIDRAATRVEVDVDIAVFPTLVLMSFGDGAEDSPSRDTVLLNVTQDLDVDKLGRVDELARNVGQDKHEVLVAYWQLRAIANSPSTFGTVFRLVAYSMMAASGTLLFFGGSLVDALIAGLLGLAGGFIELWATSSSPVGVSVLEFIVAVFTAFVTRLVISLAKPNTVCFYPTVLGALVWYLPGLSLTLGVNELVAKTYVAGSSHVIAAIFSAFQLGFGLAMGEQLVFWDKAELSRTCSADVVPLPIWAKGVWFGVYVFASNVLLNARADQWPGMVVVSFVGYAVSELTVTLGNEGSSILAALAISISGTLYSRLTTHFPLAMKTAGILVLVPGGIGVSGVAALLQDSSAGTLFVFEMLMVALSITLGLLMGKIFFPEALFGYSGRAKLDKSRMAEELRREHIAPGLAAWDEGEEEEEGMAF